MSTDRELLEMAAKAAGVVVVRWNDGLEPYSSGLGFIIYSGRLWNPLTNDGDALRLAVKLGLDVGNGVNPVGEPVIMVSHADKFCGWFEEPHGADQYAATRRAIARAAAEIGRAMP